MAELFASCLWKLINSVSEEVTSVDGRRLVTLGKVFGEICYRLWSFLFEAHMIEDLTYDMILGRDFLQKFGFKIDFENGLWR